MRLAVSSLLILLSVSLLFLVACGGGGTTQTQNPPPPPPPPSPNQLGTATAAPATCPAGTVAGSCMSLAVTCPNVPDYSGAILKITQPSGTSKGTIIFTTGGAGNDLYETHFTYGSTAVNNVVTAGFTAVQTDFSSGSTGWLTGPAADGPLTLSCRWATVAKWVHDNVRQTGTAFCATGNSAGAGAIAYALSRYGEDSIFNYVVPTGGPPFSRIDEGCICKGAHINTSCAGPVDPCYGLNANMFLDPAYGNGHCSNADANDIPLWQADSILSSDGKSVLSYSTPVHFIFGGLDATPGVANAALWQQAIISTNDFQCVADAPHEIADVQDGATTVASALVQNCH
jgi:hypothetical protein